LFLSDLPILDNKGPRPAFKAGGENREERNNRRNREMNGTTDFEKPRTGGAAGGGSAVGQNRNANRRPFDGRKRERDRQSGSDKTGVKSVDKRDGAGAHNWGTHKQDIDDLNKPPTDDEQKEGGEEAVEDAAPAAPVEEEPKEMTLDEWKAQRQAQLLQPQYNLRKAGEGEAAAQWDKMKRLDKKPEESVGRKDDGSGKKEADGKKKQVLNIEFNFNDGRRGGLGRRPGGPGGRGEGRGDRGDRGEGRNFEKREPRGDRGDRGEGRQDRGEGRGDRGEGRGDRGEGRNFEKREPRGDRENRGDRGDRPDRGDRRPRPPRENADETQEGGNGGENRGERRPPRRPRFENTRPRGDYHGHGQAAPHAPKVDDERDFPSLG
jgi:plasminogen activator inhibitor 1 RNA-binding protein